MRRAFPQLVRCRRGQDGKLTCPRFLVATRSSTNRRSPRSSLHATTNTPGSSPVRRPFTPERSSYPGRSWCFVTCGCSWEVSRGTRWAGRGRERNRSDRTSQRWIDACYMTFVEPGPVTVTSDFDDVIRSVTVRRSWSDLLRESRWTCSTFGNLACVCIESTRSYHPLAIVASDLQASESYTPTYNRPTVSTHLCAQLADQKGNARIDLCMPTWLPIELDRQVHLVSKNRPGPQR